MDSTWFLPLAVAAGVVLLTYTAFVIVEESRSYSSSQSVVQIGPWKAPVPSWWRESPESGPDKRLFVSRGQWKICFHSTSRDTAITPAERAASAGIVFDQDAEETDEERGSVRLQRIWGNATRAGEERLYLDAWLVSDQTGGTALYGTGESGVLEGVVEGPYFEACLKNLLLPDGGLKLADLLDEKAGDVLV